MEWTDKQKDKELPKIIKKHYKSPPMSLLSTANEHNNLDFVKR